MNISHSLPHLKLPAFINGERIQIDLSSFQGHWTVFCFLPRLTLIEAFFLEQQSEQFVDKKAELVGLVLHSHPLDQPWVRYLGKLHYSLLADPLGKVARVFGISKPNNEFKCHSIIFDGKGVVRCHLIHEFSGRGLAFVTEMMKHCQTQTIPSDAGPNHLSHTSCGNAVIQIQHQQV